MLAVVIAPACHLAGQSAGSTSDSRRLPAYEWANPATEDLVHLVILLEHARDYLRAGKQEPLRMLAADYVDFVDPRAPGALTRVRFADLRDPAVRRLHYEVGLPLPPGYVFIRRYLTSGEMPQRLRRRFDRHDNAAAMTLWCRFVAIAQRAERERSWAWSSPGAVEKAVSHELVHAYINSLLGPEHLPGLPKWFQEGCATYFGGALGWEVSREYERYLSVMRYIAAVKGKRGLARFVRESVRAHSVNAGLEAVGFKSEKQLLRAADAWARGARLKVHLTLAALLALGFMAAVAFVRRLKHREELEEEDEAQE